MYGKRTGCAIAAMSRLAEVYDGGRTRQSAADIAATRPFSKPMVSKILSILAQARLVIGSPGPGGGFSLARDPDDITIYDVFRLFERRDGTDHCPFGRAICGGENPCPLHDRFAEVRQAMDRLLHDTTFAAFHDARR